MSRYENEKQMKKFNNAIRHGFINAYRHSRSTEEYFSFPTHLKRYPFYKKFDKVVKDYLVQKIIDSNWFKSRS